MISHCTQTIHPDAGTGTIRKLLVVVALSFACVPQSSASEISDFAITEREGEYHVRILTVLDAPAEQVYQVITDFENSERIYPAVTKSEVLRAPDDSTVRLQNYL